MAGHDNDAQVKAGSQARKGGLISLEGVADFMGVEKRTIERWIKASDFPKPIKIGGANRWHLDSINLWAARLFAEANPTFDFGLVGEKVQVDSTVLTTQDADSVGSGVASTPKATHHRHRHTVQGNGESPFRFPVDSLRSNGHPGPN
ncbi:hypothetical protein AB1K70_19195 [Bremerella sp. JC770]|uniref:helix-turn-helix transcriptional regulator n=1 Tax=Bremerella sp. JC770 TaxID=3232137 RepID=UPI00345B0835